MVIIAWSTIAAFYQEYPDAKNALENWYDITEKADWSNISDVKIPLIRLIMWVTIGLFSI
jgi:mRNA-degrading endonuclease HigB of HigAB toxin-antitoxin module